MILTKLVSLVESRHTSHFIPGEYEESIRGAINPNEIPPSPSPSAQLRLSYYEPAPSAGTSESRTTSTPTPPRTPTAPPPIESIPDIPDYKSKSTSRPVIPPPVEGGSSLDSSTDTNKRQSKLSKLASTRSSASKSSRTRPQSSDTASIVTYPVLRPSTESQKSLYSASSDGSSVSTIKAKPKPVAPSPPQSSTSSHVRRAIQTALDLEAGDRSGESPEKNSGLRQSKLALLAQAKANANAVANRDPWMPTLKPSKLSSRHLPETHTEYLTPIANGPTATTAITTSYQSLQSLKSPKSVLPALTPAPIDGLRSPQKDPKRSKLAMKIKKAQERPEIASEPYDEDEELEMTPMFKPKTPSRSRASPSAFASLLVYDHLIPPIPKDKYSHTHKEKGKGREKEETSSAAPSVTSSTTTTSSTSLSSSWTVIGEGLPKPRKHHHRPSSSEPFAFDVPSPDDVVLNARKGTSLAQRH